MTLYYHDTLQNVQDACDKIQVNRVKKRAVEGDGTLYSNPPSDLSKIAVSQATDAELLSIPLLGFVSNVLNVNYGFDTRWAIPEQCHNDPTKYYASIPDDATLTVGVTCNTAQFDSNWYEPE